MSRKQKEAALHIQDILSQRGFNISTGKLTLPNGQQWIVFEYQQREIGIDTASGLWVRASSSDEWRCFSTPCTVSGALQVVEFLTSD